MYQGSGYKIFISCILLHILFRYAAYKVVSMGYFCDDKSLVFSDVAHRFPQTYDCPWSSV